MFGPDVPTRYARRTPRSGNWIDLCYRHRSFFAPVFALVLACGIAVAAQQQARFPAYQQALAIGSDMSVPALPAMPAQVETAQNWDGVVTTPPVFVAPAPGSPDRVVWIEVDGVQRPLLIQWEATPSQGEGICCPSDTATIQVEATPPPTADVQASPIIADSPETSTRSGSPTLILGIATLLAFLLGGMAARLRELFSPRG